MHLLQRQQEDPQGHRYSAAQASRIHLLDNFVGVRNGYALFHGDIDGKGVNLVLDDPSATASVYPVVTMYRRD